LGDCFGELVYCDTCDWWNLLFDKTLTKPAHNSNIAKKGFSGLQRSSPASAFLTWDIDTARNPFQAILRAVTCKLKNITYE
jgi:hypothetical protein